MENTTLSKRTVAFGVALAFACVINALLVVFKEKSEAVMAGMKKLTGHHWITHSVIVIVLFLGLGWALAQARSGRGISITARGLIGTVVSGVAVAGLIIIGFYLFAD
jgi:hypothetical protein